MALVIGVTGPSGSGKSTIAKRLRDEIGSAVVISMDDLYKELTVEDHERALRNEYDFDCLEAFDMERLESLIRQAKRGDTMVFHRYDHASHRHKAEPTTLEPMKLVIFEGLYLLSEPNIRALFDYMIYLDIEGDESLLRRIRRDTVSRRRTVHQVLAQYETYVKPAFEKLVSPVRRFCDVCIGRGSYNERGYQTVLSYLEKRLAERKISPSIEQ